MGEQMTFGQRLRELRKAKNLTQRELADKVAARLRKEGRSFDFTYLSKIENDKTPPPSVALITELAEVLEADANELITLAGKAPPNLGKTLKESESARTFFRSAFDADLTEEDWKKLAQELNRRKRARENPPKSGD
jgi:transcriptional regulator with XRE-family HTH domain